MKKILFIISLISFSYATYAQQEYSMHFLRDVWNSNYTNPGFAPRQTFFIGGTSVGASLSLKGLGGVQLFTEEANGSYTPNLKSIIDNVDDDVRLRASSSLELLSFGFKVKKLFFSFNATTKVNAQITLPQNIFELGYYGNERFIGQTVDIGPGLSIEAYQELGFGVNYSFNRKLSAGVRAKRLIGIASAFTSEDEFNLTTGDEYYAIQAQTNYVANISSPFLNIVAPTDGRVESTEAEFNQDAVDALVQDYQLPKGNSGWGFDIGASFNLKDRIELSASVLDLGFINYSNGVSGLKSSGTFNFDGLELQQAVQGNSVSFGSVYDSLRNLLVVEEVGGSTFRKPLAPKVYLSALARLGYWEVGGMWYNEFTSDGLVSSIGLSGRYVQDGKFSLGAVFAYHDNRFDNLGVNGTMRLGPLQLHLMVDNILVLVRPEYFEYTNIRVGANIVFGSKKMRKFRKGRMDAPAPPPVEESEGEDNEQTQ
ncbi:MAG: DUF5723 family protein [Saprospiraceae bacterium]